MPIESFDQERFVAEDARANALLKRYLADLYPNDTDSLLRLCTLHVDRPWGYRHVAVWMETLDRPFFEEDKDDLTIGYVFISAYYFLLDAVTDGHLDTPQDAVYLSHLLGGALLLWQRVCTRMAPQKVEETIKLVTRHISVNAVAVCNESKLSEEPLILHEDLDRSCVIGRSDSAFLFYDLLCLFADLPVNPKVQTLLGEFVYCIQLGDDLNDWRQDYHASRWTSLLRSCFIRRAQMLTESEVEEEIYLAGMFEEQMARIVNGFEAILQELNIATFGHIRFEHWVKDEQARSIDVLAEAVACKQALLAERKEDQK